jgi:hypothetical protein
MNAGYSKSSGPDWCSVFRIPTQKTWQTIDADKQQQQQQQQQKQQLQPRKSRVQQILKDTVPQSKEKYSQ